MDRICKPHIFVRAERHHHCMSMPKECRKHVEAPSKKAYAVAPRIRKATGLGARTLQLLDEMPIRDRMRKEWERERNIATWAYAS